MDRTTKGDHLGQEVFSPHRPFGLKIHLSAPWGRGETGEKALRRPMSRMAPSDRFGNQVNAFPAVLNAIESRSL
jgi:hypothetical protein